MSGRRDQSVSSGPYETEQQARADVTDVYEQSRRSMRLDLLAEANYAHLTVACQCACVALGAFFARILSWLANYEPATCAVVAGLITRAYAPGRAAPGARPSRAARKDGRGPYR